MSQTLSPKQAEIRDRESRILSVALPIIARDGIVGLGMDQIARRMNYTKGTIYNHFPNKEEILLALAIRATETRLALFAAAADSHRQSRRRIAAIGIACEDYVNRFGDLFAIETKVRHEVVIEKASPRRRDSLADCEARCMTLVAGVAHDAIAAGDLKLPRGLAAEDVCFGLWSITIGGAVIQRSSPGLADVGIGDPVAAIHRNCNALLDGYGWKPLYNARSFDAWRIKVLAKLGESVPEAVWQYDAAEDS